MSANILIGVTGGIAAYKTCELIRLFRESGCRVKVVMTQNAKNFVTPLTFSALTTGEVYDDLFGNNDPMLHITLAKWADKFVIVPASASVISKIASGLADDLLTTICLATEAECYIAPSMNKVMWENKATQENINKIRNFEYTILMPTIGEQACGDYGPGRMAEPEEIFAQVNKKSGELSGYKIVITAGPTYEKIDPVRYIGNFSSGKMGYALAEAAINLGAEVRLISGPVNLTLPKQCKITSVTSAEEMLTVVKESITDADIFISAAAVSDYRPVSAASNKIKKNNADMKLDLVRTDDILHVVSKENPDLFTVGFCAETENLIENAKKKIAQKNLNAIIANSVLPNGYPFNANTNVLTYICGDKLIQFDEGQKAQLARVILKEIAKDILLNQESSLEVE